MSAETPLSESRPDAAVQQAAPTAKRLAAQTLFETRAILRNGEQLMVTIILPVIILIGLVQTEFISLDTGGLSRVDFVTPGVLGLAAMTAAFTSQAIATAFDRRNGVLRLMATTPLGPGGLLFGKIAGVLGVVLVQYLVLGGVAAVLGWRPAVSGLALCAGVSVLGVGAFTALALLMASALRAEAVLAGANIVLLLLAVGGGVLLPADHLPEPMNHLALLLPSGSLGDALRGAFWQSQVPAWSGAVLLAWTTALAWGARCLFRWE